MNRLIIFCFIFWSTIILAQSNKADSLYREDQFYVTLTYNLLQNKPKDFSQHSLSSGLSFGFLRDMPFNKKRTWAIATGFGYQYNNLKTNIKIKDVSGAFDYSIDNSFDKNKIVLHEFEIPVEIRWRNSTFESHKFWRIYSGFKMSYLFANKSEFSSNLESEKINNNKDFNKIKFGTYLAVGNNTGNIIASYTFTPLLKSATIGSEELKINSFNIGFVFYIL